jgi:hypothetical protein
MESNRCWQVGVHTTCRDFVQERLPQVRLEAVDECHGRAPAATQRVAELCCERQAGGTTADNHDPVRNGRGRIHRVPL